MIRWERGEDGRAERLPEPEIEFIGGLFIELPLDPFHGGDPHPPTPPNSPGSSMAGNEQEVNNNAAPVQPRTMRDYLQPPRSTANSCIRLPVNPNAAAFTFKPAMLHHLPTFHGMESENPYQHLKDFEEVCTTFKDAGQADEVVRLKLFPFSLKDKGKLWLNALRPQSIRTWAELQSEFLKKFFPIHRTNALRRAISNFAPKEGETFYACWERYKSLLNSCPHHGHETWSIVSFFYEALTPAMRTFLEGMCNANFLEKGADEAFQYLDEIADGAHTWNTYTEEATQKPQSSGTRGLYQVRDDDLSIKVSQLTRKLEEMQSQGVNQVNAVVGPSFCVICEEIGHSTEDCHTIPAFKEVLQSPAQVNAMGNYNRPQNDPYAPRYNEGWRNHPNFGWGGNQGQNHYQNHQPQNYQTTPPQVPNQNPNQPQYNAPPKKSLEEMFAQYMQKSDRDISELKTQVSKLTTALATQERGKFPAQPVANPRGQVHAIVEVGGGSNQQQPEQLNAISTLRSGKIIDKTIVSKVSKPTEDMVPIMPGLVEAEKEKEKAKAEADASLELERRKEREKRNEEEKKGREDLEKIRNAIKVPFPQRLAQPSNQGQNPEILELFRQVKINIPLLDAVKQIPSYAKLLKDLCTTKRRMKVKKAAFMTEQVSSILQATRMPKFKDPGCPTISCIIGNSRIKRALLDLGASVNVLPYSVYLQLGLGEMKPTKVSIQLADRSVKTPRGVIEDVLVQIEDFYFPVDFIILDMEPVKDASKEIPVILGRPFLATSNAIINCKNGLCKLTFGNRTLELAVFRSSQENDQPNEDREHINMIGSVTKGKEKLSRERKRIVCLKAKRRKPFDVGNKVLFDNSRRNFFPGKQKSSWTGPYSIKEIDPFGAVIIEDSKNGNAFKVNGHRLKTFLEFPTREKFIPLEDPAYV